LNVLPWAKRRVPSALGVYAEISPLGVPPAAATGAAHVILPLDVDVVPVLLELVLVVLLELVDVLDVPDVVVEVVPEVVPDEGIQQLLFAP